MAKAYAKFEVPKDIADKTLEALRLAKQSGSVRKGVNEVTKAVERGIATLVVIAGDVEPEEVVMHIPTICEQKHIPFVFVPAKLDLGKAAGLGVPCATAAIEKAGEGQSQVKEVANWASGKMGGGSAKQEAPKQAEAKAAEAPKKERAPRKKEAAPKPQQAPAQEAAPKAEEPKHEAAPAQ
ncbi:MAG: 50S ribosomal protein L7Ae [Candidatus Micrarchaeota archaeon]|nr:50S ribosomal protein L7Ae [Candidatus Micrarchaeota archaeon]